MPNTGQDNTLVIMRASKKCFAIGSFSRLGIGIELALSWLNEAAAS